ncbi:MAG TPA: TIGR03013 family XrtA/PEP-CTERM system glycosyltransferase [Gammaproteobacteria bacterium]
MTEPNNAPRSFIWPPLRWLIFGEALIFMLTAHLAIGLTVVIDPAAPESEMTVLWHGTSMVAFGLAMVVVMHAFGMHVVRSRRSTLQLLLKYFCCAAAATVLLWLIVGLSPSAMVNAGDIGTSVALGLALLVLWRLVVSVVIDSTAMRRNVVVLGAGHAARTFHDALRRRSDRRGIEIVGYLPLPGDRTNGILPAQLLHSRTTLGRLCERNQVSEIIVASDNRRGDLPVKDLLDCRFRGITVTQAATFVERECGRIPVELAEPGWWLYHNGFADGGARRVLKRTFDLVAATLIVLPAAPLMLMCAFAIRIEDGGAVLFRQTRVGKNGREFRLVKFRSMREDAESDGVARWARRDDNRVTRVGRFLRKTRLDELPQLFNVIGGDMSLVGPRPERPEFVHELVRQIPYYEQRHAMRPGITGWAQLSYPYGASTRDALEKLKYDLYYIKNYSFAFDVAILLRTVEVVLFGKGAR